MSCKQLAILLLNLAITTVEVKTLQQYTNLPSRSIMGDICKCEQIFCTDCNAFSLQL